MWFLCFNFSSIDHIGQYVNRPFPILDSIASTNWYGALREYAARGNGANTFRNQWDRRCMMRDRWNLLNDEVLLLLLMSYFEIHLDWFFLCMYLLLLFLKDFCWNSYLISHHIGQKFKEKEELLLLPLSDILLLSFSKVICWPSDVLKSMYVKSPLRTFNLGMVSQLKVSTAALSIFSSQVLFYHQFLVCYYSRTKNRHRE